MRLVLIALAWAAGMLLAASRLNPPLVVWLAACAVAVGAVRYRRFTPAVVLLLAFVLGGMRFSLVPTTSDLAVRNDTGGLTVEGVVVSPPDVRETQTRLRINADTVTQAGQTLPTDGLVLVQTARTDSVHYGDAVRATGQLVTPAAYDTFSYADVLAREGVFGILDHAAVEVVSSGHGSPFTTTLLDLRRAARESIARALPDPYASLLTGIVLGDDSGVAPSVRDAFSATGAAHILAVSGFNMVVVTEAITRVLSTAKIGRRSTAIISISFVVLYTLLVGANSAVLRAALMSVLLITGGLLRRKTYVPASLALAVLAFSLLNPLVLWDISFQLSLSAVLGLALFTEPLTRLLEPLTIHVRVPIITPVLAFLMPAVVTTLAAQITTTPLIALTFGRVSLVVLLVNLLIIPVQPPLLILGGLATLASALVPMLAQALYWLALVLLGWTLGVVRLFAALPFAQVEFSVHRALVAIFFIMLAGGAMLRATQPAWAVRLAMRLQQRPIAGALLLTGLMIVTLTAAIVVSRPDGQLHVWMLDVGHSNAVLVQTPGGAHMLIDGGQYPTRLLTALGDRLPFNDREIEVLVVTQPDANDYAALSAVVQRYDVKLALTNGQPNLDERYLDLLAQVGTERVIAARAGYTVSLDDGATLEVLSPSVTPDITDSLDAGALALRLTYGDISVLLPGDLSAEGQAALLSNGHYPLATVMQLPQHGTGRSLHADFLAAAQPQLILLQADAANRRGDPNPDTLALLGDTPIFRTDERGTVHVWTNGTRLWIEPEK